MVHVDQKIEMVPGQFPCAERVGHLRVHLSDDQRGRAHHVNAAGGSRAQAEATVGAGRTYLHEGNIGGERTARGQQARPLTQRGRHDVARAGVDHGPGRRAGLQGGQHERLVGMIEHRQRLQQVRGDQLQPAETAPLSGERIDQRHRHRTHLGDEHPTAVRNGGDRFLDGGGLSFPAAAPWR